MPAKPPLPLSIAIADYRHTRPLKDGRVKIDGVRAEFVSVKPQIAAFRRMVRDLEFDICEMAPTTYLIAREHGVPITALPVFVMRRFHHGGLRVNPATGIAGPKDLEGKRVGVRAWSVTTGVWTRDILRREFDLDMSKVRWIVDDEEHVRDMRLPDYVTHAPPGRTLADMMAAGELDAAFDGNAGIGRAGDPQSGWQERDASAWPDLFANAAELEAQWFARTGVYPMHGTIVVKSALLAQHPWLAQELFDAFMQARDIGGYDTKYSALAQTVSEPLPYGFSANSKTIDALIDAAHAQGLIRHKVAAQEAFAEVALNAGQSL